jgi:glycosyltransferase involved in cell wall biosynthesis
VARLLDDLRSAYARARTRASVRREARYRHPRLPHAAAIDASVIDAAEALRTVGPISLLDHALATGSPVLRDVLALRATRGAADWRMLRSALLDGSAGRLPLRAPRLVDLLRVVRTHPDDADGAAEDRAAIARGAALAHDRWPWFELDSPARRLLIELLLEAGERERAARLLGPRFGRGHAARLVALDVDNPFTGPGGDPGRWESGWAALMAAGGLEPVRVEAGDAHPFDRLRCDAPAGSVTVGPLVSIVLSVRDPGPELLTAVDSIVAQTYARWEVLLVDDGSGPGSNAVLAEAARRDARIRLIRHSESAGPYVRRNDALASLGGELVSFHDGDDWSHPRRLERQIAPLLGADPPLATVCASLRVTDRLAAVHGRGRTMRLTESSIIMRRSTAVDLIGYFDAVRRAADSGYRLRLETQGEVRLIDPGVPLSLVRFRPTTLSGADLRDGYTHPARAAYADAHAHWLRAEIRAGRVPRLEQAPAARAFPAHPWITRGEPRRARVAAVLIGDGRAAARAPARYRLSTALQALSDTDEPVGLWHAPEPGPGPATAPFSSLVSAERARGALLDLVRGDEAEAPLVAALSTAAALSLAGTIDAPGAALLLVIDPDDPLDALRAPAAEEQLRRSVPAGLPDVRRVSAAELAVALAR